MFHLGFQGRNQLTVLGEDCQVEVVVVVGDEDLAGRVDADADRIIGQPLAADLTQEDALVAEHLDAVGPVV